VIEPDQLLKKMVNVKHAHQALNQITLAITALQVKLEEQQALAQLALSKQVEAATSAQTTKPQIVINRNVYIQDAQFNIS
jgi:hypothetical protein